MAIEYNQRDSQRLFEEKLKQEAKEKEANMARKKQKIPGPHPVIGSLDLEPEEKIALGIDMLKHFHSFNLLDSKSVRGIGTYFGIGAELICRKEGITYDIVK